MDQGYFNNKRGARNAVGVAIVVLSSLCIAFVPSSAKISTDEGASSKKAFFGYEKGMFFSVFDREPCRRVIEDGVILGSVSMHPVEGLRRSVTNIFFEGGFHSILVFDAFLGNNIDGWDCKRFQATK